MTQKNTTAAPARVFGYVRVSTAKQRKERQIDNIKAAYPNAVIIEEAFTGTSMQRPAWTRLYNKLAQGDTVIFDEVSRMSRNAEEGFSVYEELYNRGVTLIFLKEPGINSDVYRSAAQRRIEAANIATGNNAVDNFTAALFDAINQLLMDLAKQQIEAAFSQAEAEVNHLHQRTAEGVRKAIERYDREELEGKPHTKGRPGRANTPTITTKKSIAAKEVIRKHNKDFGGSLNDIETMKQIGQIARNSYYRYKAQLKAELAAQAQDSAE